MYYSPSTASILESFSHSISEASGSISGTYQDGSRLFVRALLPLFDEAQREDQMQGGVALRAFESEISVHPFLFREVCSNGAVMAHAVESCFISDADYSSEFELQQTVRKAVLQCSSREVFDSNMREIRNSVHSEISLAIMMAGMFDHLPTSVINMIFLRLEEEQPRRTRFALMNAVTSVARDTQDPETRWHLEELGGAIGANLLPAPTDDLTGNYVDQHLHFGS